MKLGRLNHVGIATPSIERSLELYRMIFAAEPHGEPFDLPAQGVRVCFVDTPNSQIELIEPLGEGSPSRNPLEEPARGQHHVCFEVPDIHAAKSEFPSKGARILGRAAHRRPWDARLFRPSQGHGRGSNGNHGDAEPLRAPSFFEEALPPSKIAVTLHACPGSVALRPDELLAPSLRNRRNDR